MTYTSDYLNSIRASLRRIAIAAEAQGTLKKIPTDEPRLRELDCKAAVLADLYERPELKEPRAGDSLSLEFRQA